MVTSETDREEIYHRKTAIFLEHIWNPIRPGVMEMLQEAKVKGLKLRDRLGLLDAYWAPEGAAADPLARQELSLRPGCFESRRLALRERGSDEA